MEHQLFNPDEVLQVAEHLSRRDGEANARSAISRAYYGAFLIARNLADIADETSRAHSETLRHYVELGERSIADDLWSLRCARNRADYKTDINVSDATCRQAMLASRRVRAALMVIAGRAKYRARDPMNILAR
jgi:uncharacterized protein (UPF0332 family)